MGVWVEEYQRALSPRELAIHEGRSGLTPAVEESYRRVWRGQPANPPRQPALIPDCRFRGPPTGEEIGCRSCGGSVRLKVFECSVHGSCTIGKKTDGRACCKGCGQREAPPAGLIQLGTPPAPRTAAPYRWVSTADLAADAVALAGRLPPDVSGVAGVPRSGMIPAAVIATHLHLPLYELATGGQLRRLGHGSRGRAFGFHARGGPVAVVDDTVYGGGAMRTARAGVKEPAVFAAVYARPEAAGAVDVYARLLPSPHLLEWNLFNCGVAVGNAHDPVFGAGVAADLDGVILHDAHSGGPALTPYLVPRTVTLPLVVTGRPEGHRGATVRQLAAAGARYARLVMRPDAAPDTPEAHAAHKARHYAASRCGFFVESDPAQARLIFELSGKPVVCPRAGVVHQ